MRDHTPTVYLLAGSSSPAALTYARTLEAQGVIRLCGERVDVAARLADEVAAGRDVVLAEGLSEADTKAFYQRLVESHGAQWCVIHFSDDHADTVRRLSQRLPTM